jgi:hypothetical protein
MRAVPRTCEGMAFFWIRDEGWGLALVVAGDGLFWGKR